MKTDQTQIFLSYARKDVAEVNKLYDKLKSYGFSPWQDHKDLIGGMDWMDEIIETINSCAFFVACISRHTIDRRTGVLVREINEALDVAKFRRKGTVFIIPVRIEKVDFPKEFKKYHGIDLFESEGFEKLISALRHGLKQLGIDNPLNLRSQPIKNLTQAEAGQMIRERNFYDFFMWPGIGIQHEYEVKTIGSDRVVIDHTTGLMWQQSGSEKNINYKKAKAYIKELNKKRFAGFDDWRLPTLEEAMSLMENIDPTEKVITYIKESNEKRLPTFEEAMSLMKDTEKIDPVFDKTQCYIWTSDLSNASSAWSVHFLKGHCFNIDIEINLYSVRAVRSV